MLDIKVEVEKLNKMYKEQESRYGFNLLVYGDKGSGKTKLLTTGRQPIHIDSFDPGGTKSIADEIAAGHVVVDTRWEYDSQDNPEVWINWLTEMERRRKEGYFEYFGTYAIDSATLLQQASMNQVLKRKRRLDWIPKVEPRGGDNDYVLARVPVYRAIGLVLSLPCDCIITAHADFRQEEGTERPYIGPYLIGQLATTLPLLFDEMYYARVENTAKGKVYVLLTVAEGLYRASSRLSRKGLLQAKEEPDLKNILRKVGYSTLDKPMPWLEK